MADTRVQLKAEDWIRQNWLPARFDQRFRRERLELNAGGVFDFDAVSADNKIVANISTSSGVTAGGRRPVGKIQKLRADMLFLLMARAERRLIVLTEVDMYELCLREKENGRVPVEIEFEHVELPVDMKKALKKARGIASDEMSKER